MKLDKKVAVVTAGRGIGRAIAENLAMEGASIALSDINLELANETAEYIKDRYNTEVMSIRTDVSNQKENSEMIDKTVSKFGTVDILVCNAGIVRPPKPIEDITRKNGIKSSLLT